MSGQRHKIDSTGDLYQDFAKVVFGPIAALVEVPRQRDYGIDFFGQLLRPTGPATQTVTHLFAIQVKGGQERLRYGGIEKGKWKEYEFTWLKSLATPLYLAHVDEGLNAVELFSLWPLWRIFWPMAPHPFSVRFVHQQASSSPYSWQPPRGQADPRSSGRGDGRSWTVDLGPPLLRLTIADMKSKSFQGKAASILQTWVTNDRLNLMRYLQFIPVLVGVTQWTTNSKQMERTIWQFSNPTPGMNLARLSQTASPVFVNLGIHLRGQNDEAAFRLISLLEWFDGRGDLDGIGKELLEGLKKARDIGVGPAEVKEALGEGKLGNA
jgi:hypothetical protein